MAHLWLTNIPDGFTDDDIAAFLEKYGFPRCDAITRVPGDGTRPGAVVAFDEVDEEVLRKLQPRIDRVFVGNSTVRAQVAPPPRPDPR